MPSSEMTKILLKGMAFKAYHGFYEKEKELGNNFELNVCLEYDFECAAKMDELKKTIDYEQVYSVIEGVMNGESVNLIETLASKIKDKLLVCFPELLAGEVEVIKLNPPISGVCKSTSVILDFKKTTIKI